MIWEKKYTWDSNIDIILFKLVIENEKEVELRKNLANALESGDSNEIKVAAKELQDSGKLTESSKSLLKTARKELAIRAAKKGNHIIRQDIWWVYK